MRSTDGKRFFFRMHRNCSTCTTFVTQPIVYFRPYPLKFVKSMSELAATIPARSDYVVDAVTEVLADRNGCRLKHVLPTVIHVGYSRQDGARYGDVVL
jgi:hypothetical protein